MIFLKTSKVKDIWEKDGIAGFNTKFTGEEIVEYSNKLPVKAIGFYSDYQNEKLISILEIVNIKKNLNSTNDLELEFRFMKKINIVSSDFEKRINRYDVRYLFHLEDELVSEIFKKFGITINDDLLSNEQSDDFVKLTKEISNVICDYRSEDGVTINVDTMEKWVKQFDQNDRIFILQELLHIFKERYITKHNTEIFLLEIVKKLSKDFKYDDPKSFLQNCYFIDHQPDGKSQKELLKLFDNLIINEYGISISECGLSNQKHFIYLDDFLCTGDTLFKGLATPNKGWLFKEFKGKTILDKIKGAESELVLTYFFIHNLNYHKFIYRLTKNLNADISSNITCYRFLEIENDYKKLNSKLDYLLPVRENQSERVIKFFDELNINSDFGIFRDPNYPKQEKFFSSKENRIRFENILLNKGLELYDLAGSGRNPRMRPLGYGLTSHKNFGFGTLCFSWRNVPFNVPMVFWYPHHDWIPLFERKFVNY